MPLLHVWIGLFPLVHSCSRPWKISLLACLRWSEDHDAVLLRSSIYKYFLRLFRWSAHLAPAHIWINGAQRRTLFTPMKRGQEHAANSWLMPLSNAASCQSLLILRALPALSLARLRSCCAPLQTWSQWLLSRGGITSLSCACACAWGPESVCVSAKKKGSNYMVRGGFCRQSHGRCLVTQLSCVSARGTVNRWERARDGAASRPAVFSGWDPLKSGTVGSILDIAIVGETRYTVNTCESVFIDLNKDNTQLFHSIFKLLYG